MTFLRQIECTADSREAAKNAKNCKALCFPFARRCLGNRAASRDTGFYVNAYAFSSANLTGFAFKQAFKSREVNVDSSARQSPVQLPKSFNHEKHEEHERTANNPFFYFVPFVFFVVQVLLPVYLASEAKGIGIFTFPGLLLHEVCVICAFRGLQLGEAVSVTE